ncbi:hypothetical protein ACA910_010104 [Epithemia clementina (nom. ined.)]
MTDAPNPSNDDYNLIVPVDRDCIECDGPDCFKTGPSKRCSRCHTEFYCSVECQKKAWKNHKPYCIQIDDMRFRSAGLMNGVNDVLVLDDNHKVPNNNNTTVVDASRNSQCPICFSDPIPNAIILKSCRHAFCLGCLVAWQKHEAISMLSLKRAKTTCPICRSETGEDVEDSLVEKTLLLTAQASRCDQNNEERRLRLLSEALSCTDQLLEADCPRIDVYLNKAQILVKLGRFAEAIQLVDETIEENERRINHPVVQLCQAADQAEAQGDMAEFERLQEEVVHAFDTLGPVPTRLQTSSYTDCYLIQADAYEAQENYAAAKEIYFQALQTIEDPAAVSPVLQRKIFMGLAKCAYELGVYEKSIAASDAALEMNRHFPGVHKYKALSLKKQGNLDKAIRTMKRAVLYETPWDEENKAEVRKLYISLCKERETK